MDHEGLVLLSHPGSPPFVQQTARALYEANLLSKYVTRFTYQPDTVFGRTVKAGMRLLSSEPEKQLARRQLTEIPAHLVETHPLPELLRTAIGKSLGAVPTDLIWEKSELWFDRMVAKKHLNGERAAYAYEHSALDTFKTFKRRGGLCIYEMPICHHRTTAEILEPEFDKFPELRTSYQRHLAKNAVRRNARKDDELAQADLVVVNSGFTRNSLIVAGVQSSRIAVIPLGSPPVQQWAQKGKGPFVFLYAGTQSVRKGVHYLLDAWRKLKPSTAELWLVGHMDLPPRLLTNLPGKVVIRESVPQAELSKLYAAADVLVFPSLAEGFGMVITEAMAHGLPVITTANTVGPELITDGSTGFIVPIRDARALMERMEWCLDNRDELRLFGDRARTKVGRWQWSDYRAALGARITDFLNEHSPSQNY